jgi:hypothetical protein
MSESSNNPICGVWVTLPHHLCVLAGVGSEIELAVTSPVSQRSILDALESRYPMLRGTIRDHVTLKRRAKVRFFADEEDVSHDPPDQRLPDVIASGVKPFMIIGAISGG